MGLVIVREIVDPELEGTGEKDPGDSRQETKSECSRRLNVRKRDRENRKERI